MEGSEVPVMHWCGKCSLSDRKALQRVVKTAQTATQLVRILSIVQR